jgi:isoleucyl-tRNA synthetase
MDAYQRLRTMQGFGVRVRQGLDCHGLPVEVAVERELGLSGMAGIEAYGAERFAARCRESAIRHGEAFSALSTRLGCWSDAAAARPTMDAGYIDSVWRSLRQIFDAGLLERSHQVTPYCPRCQTPLSVHDVCPADARRRADGAADTGLLVRLRLAALPDGANPMLRDADLLVWIARPWTLVGNAAVAVHRHQTYALARLAGHDDRVIVAEARLVPELGEDWHVAARVSGAELAGASYYPAPGLAGAVGTAGPRPVISGYFVSMSEGTGIVPVAPAYGADDLTAARTHRLPIIDPIGKDGRLAASLPVVGGMFFSDAEPVLIRALSDNGALLATRMLPEGSPQCWRCGVQVMTRAMSVWCIRTTAIAGRLRAALERIRCAPSDAVTPGGPLAGWVRGEADWTVSRTRYWGTPLPLWECSSGHVTCVGSLAELSGLAGRDLTGIDPHRPLIDGVVFACSRCGAPARRVPDVLDARYDAGWMPLVSAVQPAGTQTGRHNSPHTDLIVANADPPRGWFGALLTIGTLVSERPVAGTVLSTGPVLDDRGRVMSRSRGNLVEPSRLIERHGADSVRWFLTASAPPGAARALSEVALERIGRTVLATYWDVAECLLGCAGDGPDATPPAFRPLWDRWILSELQQLITGVTSDLDELRPDAAGVRIEGFIDSLANWYVPTMRRRLGSGEQAAESAAAVATLRECLDVVTRLMAPIIPFLTDEVWVRMRAWDAERRKMDWPDSVHMASWPAAEPGLVDDQLSRQVALVRRLAGLGRSARAGAQIAGSRPLPRALVAATEIEGMPGELRVRLATELKVRALELSQPGTQLALAGWAVAASHGELVALDVANDCQTGALADGQIGGLLVGLTCLARHATAVPGLALGHHLEVVGGQEPDQQAVAPVIPGDAGNNGDLYGVSGIRWTTGRLLSRGTACGLGWFGIGGLAVSRIPVSRGLLWSGGPVNLLVSGSRWRRRTGRIGPAGLCGSSRLLLRLGLPSGGSRRGSGAGAGRRRGRCLRRRLRGLVAGPRCVALGRPWRLPGHGSGLPRRTRRARPRDRHPG